jgi:uncharacterized membrane protein
MMRAPCLSLALLLLALTGVQAGDDYVFLARDPTPAGKRPRYVVPDPETKDGSAQAALPGKSQPGDVVSSFYGYTRTSGRYRFYWRVKIADNAATTPAFTVHSNHEGGGGERYQGGKLTVTCNQFAAANAYQEFSYTAEKPEGGFFGSQLFWGGGPELRVDSCRIVLEEPFTEAEQVKRAGGLELPKAWSFPAPGRYDLHVAKGLWWEYFGLSEALGWLGGGGLRSSYFDRGQYGTSLRGFPATANDFMRFRIIVLANVDAWALGPRGRLLLEEYVRQGGSLFVFGGRYALSEGHYGDTALARLLPATFAKGDRRSAPEGLVIAPTAEAATLLPAGLTWPLRPRVYYYHAVTPRPEAQVWLRAGEQPLLLTWQVGAGRVAFWAGTPEGKPGPDALAVWQWGDQPALMAAVLAWLAATPAAPAAAFDPAIDGAALDRLATLGIEENADAQIAVLLDRLAARCHDATFARELANAIVAADADPGRPTVDLVATAVRPFVDAGWESLARSLLSAEQPGKRGLGLRLLGRCRAAGAGAQLASVLQRGSRALGGAELGDPGGDLLGGEERVILGAVQGLGALGDAQYLPQLTAATAHYAKLQPPDGDTSIQGDLREELYQHLLLARLHLGDATAAAPLVQALLKNILAMEQYQNFLDVMLVYKDDVVTLQGRNRAKVRLPVLRQRQRSLLEVADGLPPACYPALAEALAKANDAVLLPFAYAAFAEAGRAPLPGDLLPGLVPLVAGHQVPELRLLGCRLLTRAPAPGPELLAQTLQQLAASPRPADARFAVQRLGLLPPAARQSVLAAAAAHPDPAVQRLARLSAVP